MKIPEHAHAELVSKETYLHGKRGLLSVKRDLFHMAKEAYSNLSIGLFCHMK